MAGARPNATGLSGRVSNEEPKAACFWLISSLVPLPDFYNRPPWKEGRKKGNLETIKAVAFTFREQAGKIASRWPPGAPLDWLGHRVGPEAWRLGSLGLWLGKLQEPLARAREAFSRAIRTLPSSPTLHQYPCPVTTSRTSPRPDVEDPPWQPLPPPIS